MSLKRKIERTDLIRAMNFKDLRIKHKGTFDWVQRVNVFVYKSDKKHHEFTTNKQYEGIHIVSNVKRHIRSLIEKGEIELPKISQDVMKTTIFFNKDNVRNNLEKEIVSIDFKRCYWVTLFKLGYITEKIYDSGLIESKKDKKGVQKDVNYKLACNMSIGSMGVTEYWEKYVEGVLIESGVRKCELNPIRLHVVQEVYKTAISIINTNKSTKEGFLWFLTDCFYVTKEVEELYVNEIKKSGYEHKIEYYEKYELQTGFTRSSGAMRYFVKWGAWDLPLAKSFHFNYKNDINELSKKIKL